VLYLVFTELIDGAAGVLGALMLVACRLFRRVSVAYLSQPLALLLILLAVWAYLKWRQKSSPARAAFIGASLGALAITRPMEAVCLGSLLLIAVAISGAPPLQGWGRDSFLWCSLSGCHRRLKACTTIAPPSLKRWGTQCAFVLRSSLACRCNYAPRITVLANCS
jgi:4-amino-4-deoxy-L-arabinose transferase-like glycosyltransferase